MNCVFCSIINRKTPAEIIYEDSLVISFLDIRPFNFGHTLVVPKHHSEDLLSVPEEYLSRLFLKVQDISGAVVRGLGAAGFNVLSNNGRAAGQTVFHCHIHIIPRFDTDPFKFKMNLKKYNDGEMRLTGDKIRLFLPPQEK